MVWIYFYNCTIILHDVSFFNMSWLRFAFFSLIRWLSASSSHLYVSLLVNLFMMVFMMNFLFLNIFLLNILRLNIMLNIVWFLISILVSCDWLSSVRCSLNSVTSSYNFRLTLVNLTFLITRDMSLLRLIRSWYLMLIIVIWISSRFVSSDFYSSSLVISLKRHSVRQIIIIDWFRLLIWLLVNFSWLLVLRDISVLRLRILRIIISSVSGVFLRNALNWNLIVIWIVLRDITISDCVSLTFIRISQLFNGRD